MYVNFAYFKNIAVVWRTVDIRQSANTNWFHYIYLNNKKSVE